MHQRYPEVHYAKKQSIIWIGYKVHLTETCDNSGLHLITHVETTPAPVVDRDALEDIHAALDAKGLLPNTTLLMLATSRPTNLWPGGRKASRFLGRLPRITSGRPNLARASRCRTFLLDWEREVAICPVGHES
ncbi:hypothetical protein [Microvirga sp. KLBC 81]|uniref:hypothetical protein n=1 Tax=Microvirga sp. KLBC 81 TaxID=1862707 RepID=UPI001FDF63A6|nr:hypothetical protein [Microvirga sp. KLBC 81]